jgi:hypothetical protein
MPSFYFEDVDISVSEFLDSCSSIEKKELIKLLQVDNYYFRDEDNENALEKEFNDEVIKLLGKRHSLTNEEEELILKITKKLL